MKKMRMANGHLEYTHQIPFFGTVFDNISQRGESGNVNLHRELKLAEIRGSFRDVGQLVQPQLTFGGVIVEG